MIRQHRQFYLYPYQHVTRASLGNVLVIGAGNGNDVAVALSKGARHVDAVEIDPVLLRIGGTLTRPTRIRARGSPSMWATAVSTCRTQSSITT